MSDDCRAKCDACHGRGYTTCFMCDGSGWVCPGCRGMRWLRTGKVDSSGTYGIERCESCLTLAHKMETVKRYMDRWQQEHPLAPPAEGEAQ